MHNKKDAQKKIEAAGKRGMKKIIISSICAFLGAICIIGLLILLWNIRIGQRGDAFKYEVTKKGQFIYYLAGIMK